jgi:methyl-CpG-binding domain protein 4
MREPFWMLVACRLVNRAPWEVAEGVLLRLRRRWPSPRRLAAADADALLDLLRPLGLQGGRTRDLRRLAAAWRARRPATRADVLALPGCGPYAADSWALFVEGRRDVSPSDGKLLWWLCRGL